MALTCDVAMVLFYDIDGDPADHDDWHSYEHFHERLSVPGFRRASRWIASVGAPRYLVIYEVDRIDVLTSKPYLDRLNNPSAWTGEIMPRFRGMTRGFCHVAASAGFGFGCVAAALRFLPTEGRGAQLADWLSNHALPAAASRRGVVGAHLLRPSGPPPMTREQALRGADQAMPWLVLLTAYDDIALQRAAAEHLGSEALNANGAGDEILRQTYRLHYLATAEEAARTEPSTALPAPMRGSSGPRN